MSDAQLPRIDGLSESEPAGLDARPHDTETIVRLATLVSEQARLIAERSVVLAHDRRLFELASTAARIGLWECELPAQRLRWSNGVYDIFGLKRGQALDREQVLSLYTPQSASTLEALRNKAVEDRTGFCFDAEIVSRQGRRRWVRVTATVESEDGIAVRIFGIKQDITDEKLLADRMRYLAEFDVMTGLGNRQRFQSSLDDLGKGRLTAGALLLVDLDGFKTINDTYGHSVGDVCLREAAERLHSVCRRGEPAFRIGGDEFAVFAPVESADEMAAAIVRSIGQPVSRDGQTLRLGASVGITRFDGRCKGDEVFTRADKALYAAKAAGRGTYRRFDAADEPSPT